MPCAERRFSRFGESLRSSNVTLSRENPPGVQGVRSRTEAAQRKTTVEHHPGKVLAYVMGSRKDAVCLKLQVLLAPLGITPYSTDKAGVYRRHLLPEQHTGGKLT